MSTKKIHIGCSGFYNAHWKKVFYPETLPSSKWLNYYSENFNTIEINSTFYKFPVVETLQKWYDRTPENFTFSIKAPKLITHLNRFKECEQLIEDFYSISQKGLKEKLGYLLFQLPPSIVYDEELLVKILNCLNPDFKNVIEFRHISWWRDNVYKTLTEHKAVFCSVNHPKLPNTIIANGGVAYIRLHGNPEMFYSNYPSDFLDKLRQFILTKKEINEAFVYFNNTASTSGILNALELQGLILNSK